MTTIELRFPAGRFHGTSWGRHVNEGVAEWPPSPYRLLRALYDAWKRKHPELPERTISGLLKALATEPPEFRLQRVTASHTRAYLSSNTLDPRDKSLIFDAFVAVKRSEPSWIVWPSVTLEADEQVALTMLLGSLNYVGRSESWVDARLCCQPGNAAVRCAPAGSADEAGELVQVACVRSPGEYSGKRAWLNALTFSTTELLKERVSAPPLLRMIPYVRPVGAVVAHVPRPVAPGRPLVEAVLLSLESKVLPLVTTTVEVAEQIRVRLMGIHKKLMGDDASRVSWKFSGKNTDGTPRINHEHVYILPIAKNDEPARIDRVLVMTRHRDGFDHEEVRAILGLQTLWRGDGLPELYCVATWKGALADLEKLMQPTATCVVSRTPFIPPRHWRKGRGTTEEFIEGEVRRECANHGLKPPRTVEVLRDFPGPFAPVEFRRNRKKDASQTGFGIRIEFDEPVTVPFSLGYGSHYGLGQFSRDT